MVAAMDHRLRGPPRSNRSSQGPGQVGHHRAQRTVRAAVVVNAIAIAWLVAAAVNRDMLRVFDRFVRLGGGSAALCYLVIPVTLPAAGAVLAYRARSSTTRAKLKNNDRTYLIMSSAALAAWLTTFVAIWIAG